MPSPLRNFCFTINNYVEETFASMRQLAEISSYLIYGKEVGESKTPHLQGYCELRKRTRFNRVKSFIPTAHIEPRKGTAVQARDYCAKDGDFKEHGELSKSGKRTDIENLYYMASQGKSDIEIGSEYPRAYVRFYKAVDRVRFNYARLDNKFAPVKVLVFCGAAGTGKTRKAYAYDPDLYRLSQGDTIWWDGYQGQKTILIDDFYGWIKYGSLLQLLDGYKYQLPIKGAFTWKQWNTVIITSNVHPEEWYTKGFTPALKRRIIEISVGEQYSPQPLEQPTKGI